MLSKNTLKFIKSLHQKKFRKQADSFFVEGSKNVTELLVSDFEVTHLLFTSGFGRHNQTLISTFSGECYEVGENVLEGLGSFQTNNSALAVARMKKPHTIIPQKGEFVLALDDVRDPGNLGTILRIADWYGIKKVLLSVQSADFYNPKVLHASMGSFTRIDFAYVDLAAVLAQTDVPTYGAFLDGENIHSLNLSMEGILVMGNESHGISPNVAQCIHHRITIPSFGAAESLNVAIATAVICDNFRRFGR
ncbi:MAG: RNA methyltransferase [Lunatimonas sp.]|uniref:TrmH family RNA methyltransferase n=1 Tax=Lunatimonas sp. TaxID=2060141 RepID=UPI00263BABC6|nr:RNA methyltransferase [Lunatimonas sp.]MCC5937948.1 RNA methyltransferase [Lunatimonas sp.]